MRVNVKTISLADLEAVKLLGRRYRATLGFLPDGAYDDHASQGHILGAYDHAGGLTGYLLYRVSRRRAVIAHLCTMMRPEDKELRGAW